ASAAVVTARSISRACNKAAPTSPRLGISRVFAKPGIGALASTATATGSAIAVFPGETFRGGAEEVSPPQPPHPENGLQDPMLFQAAPRCDHALAQAKGSTDALEALAQCDVFHERDRGKAACRVEGATAHEDRLIAGRDSGDAGAQAHQPTDERK